MFIEMFQSDPGRYFSWVGFAAFSICVHEFAHAYTAVRYGDRTPERHLTLNPLVQMGFFSLMMLVLFGIAWGAVPVDPRGTGSNKKDAMISFAGPLANLILCAFFALLAVAAFLLGQQELSELLTYGGYVNGALFFFNLVPLPPLDGFGILRALVPSIRKHDLKARQFMGIAFLLFWISPASSFVFLFGQKIFAFFITLWSILAGWIAGLFA